MLARPALAAPLSTRAVEDMELALRVVEYLSIHLIHLPDECPGEHLSGRARLHNGSVRTA